MALINAGYFTSTFFPSSYWHEDYWVEYGTTWLIRFFAEMEKTSIGTTLIDHRFIKPGLVGTNPTHDLIVRLE